MELDDKDEFRSQEEELAYRLDCWRRWAKHIEYWCASLEDIIIGAGILTCTVLGLMSFTLIIKNWS